MSQLILGQVISINEQEQKGMLTSKKGQFSFLFESGRKRNKLTSQKPFSFEPTDHIPQVGDELLFIFHLRRPWEIYRWTFVSQQNKESVVAS